VLLLELGLLNKLLSLVKEVVLKEVAKKEVEKHHLSIVVVAKSRCAQKLEKLPMSRR